MTASRQVATQLPTAGLEHGTEHWGMESFEDEGSLLL